MVSFGPTPAQVNFKNVVAGAEKMASLYGAVMRDIQTGGRKEIDEAAASLIARNPSVLSLPYVLARAGSPAEHGFFVAALQSVTEGPVSGLTRADDVRFVEGIWEGTKEFPAQRFALFASLVRLLAVKDSAERAVSELYDPESRLVAKLETKFKEMLFATLLFEFRVNPDDAQKHVGVLLRGGVKPAELLSYAGNVHNLSHFPAALRILEAHYDSVGGHLDSETLPVIAKYLSSSIVDVEVAATLVNGYRSSKVMGLAEKKAVAEACSTMKRLPQLLINLLYAGSPGYEDRLCTSVAAIVNEENPKELGKSSKLCLLRAIAIIFDADDTRWATQIIDVVKASSFNDSLRGVELHDACPEFIAARKRLVSRIGDELQAHKISQFLS